MAKEPHGPVHLFRVLDEKLQSSDKAAAIELYYELLSSGHSVGEILSAVSPIRSEAERDDTAAAEHPRSGLDEAATDFTSEVAWVDAAQANALSTPGLSVPEDAEGCVTKKPAAADSASPDGLGSGGSQQLRRESLPGSEPDFVESPDVVEATGVHTATGREVALRSGDPERLQPNRFPSIAKRIAFGTLYTLAVASASIAGISIVRGGRDAEPMTSRLQS